MTTTSDADGSASVPSATLDCFRSVDTAAVSDAMDSLGLPCVLAGVRPRVPGSKIVGVAYTVTYRTFDPSDSVFRNAANYIDDVPEGSVVVVDNAGSTECTNWGNILTSVAIRRGILGTVLHGSARDVAEIRELAYPLFSTGVTMVSGKNRVECASVGSDIDVHGVVVRPGDVIVADDNGAIVIPASIAIDVAERALRVAATERRITAAADDGLRLDEARTRFGYSRPWDGARAGM